SLAADGLDRRRTDARLGGQELEPPPRSADDGVVAVSVDHGAVADDVVHDDQAAATRQLEGPPEVLRVVRLVGVDEDHVERPLAGGGDRGQRLQRGPDAYLGHLAQPGACQVGARHLGVTRVHLQRDQVAVRRQRTRQPDGAVSAERPDLEDAARSLTSRQHVQQLALVRRYVVRRQARCRVRLERRLERRVGPDEQIGEIAVDRGPVRRRHGPWPAKAASGGRPVPEPSDAVGVWLPAGGAGASATRSPSGAVTTRLVKPGPGAVKVAPVMPAANSSSDGPAVASAPLLAVVPAPDADVPASKGAAVRNPEYSVMRRSTKTAAWAKATRTALPPAGAAAIFAA